MIQKNNISTDIPLEEIVEEIRLLSKNLSDKNEDIDGIHQINKAYNRLYRNIQNHPRLAQPRSYQFEGLYQEIKEEAMQRLFFYLKQDDNLLRKFKPDKASLMQWVNFLLTHRFFPEATRQLTLPMTVGRIIPDELRREDIDAADWKTLADTRLETPSLSDKMRDCLQTDPTGEFVGSYVDHHPEANFQRMSLERLDGVSWDTLAQKWGVKASTLRSFFTRSLTKLAPVIKQYIIES